MTTRAAEAGESQSSISGIVASVARLLPAQGPISTFIHHNTLHAFEHVPFEEAVTQASQLFECEPYLPEEDYRKEIEKGRITERDLTRVRAEALGEREHEIVAGILPRGELRSRIVYHGIPEASGAALAWLLHEMDALERFRTNVPPEAREGLAGAWGRGDRDEVERSLVRELWDSCLARVRRTPPPAPSRRHAPVRHRDFLLAACGLDTDSWALPVLTRFTGAYLDQGFAHWTMPERDRGMYAAFLRVYGNPVARYCGPWAPALLRLIADDERAQRTPLDSLESSLEALGVAPDERESSLLATALALRGWAGMVRHIEERPDRAPARPVPARLLDYLAVQLLLERAALQHGARAVLGLEVDLRDLRSRLAACLPPTPPRTAEERAWPLFHVAQLCGLDGSRIRRMTPGELVELETELLAFDGLERRRVLHLAFEAHLRNRLYDALSGRAPVAKRPVSYQAIFCLDEREESFRRHLEEVEPSAETLGAAGFFGVAMYYKGEADARARPLCPISIRPEHYVEASERSPEEPTWMDTVSGLGSELVHVGSRGLFRGALVSVLGMVALVPLVLKVLFPKRAARLFALSAGRRPHRGRLQIERTATPPPVGRYRGFTIEEMAAIVKGALGDAGLQGRLAPLVAVIGHASDSLNNPHHSAYDCGACGGGPGGANARAFAMMANDPRVRSLLGELGFPVPEGAWFVGGEHNTTDDSVELFDLDRVPPERRPLLGRLRESLETAATRNAQERCRRFDGLELASPEDAFEHVASRRRDLAQPRPEYNHATNAFCVVGRRERTRGLFLDRRSFLVSYDPTGESSDGASLHRLLRAVVPVVAGINLEYLFGTVDNSGYGSGTKLPHNVTGLLGVMDGSGSDLRTGLWAQTVEIHEPVRLTLVVESPPERLRRILDEDTALSRWIENRWIFAACLDPSTGELRELGPLPGCSVGSSPPSRPSSSRGPRSMASWLGPPHRALRERVSVPGPSASWFRGKRGHLGIVEIAPARPGEPT